MSWTMRLLTPPTEEPVTVDEARVALRIDDDQFDAVLPGNIATARAIAEQELGLKLTKQTWRFESTDWPSSDECLEAYRPTACAITYWNGSAWASLSTNAYVYAPDSSSGTGTVLAPVLGTDWPSLGEIAVGPRVRIDLTCGPIPSTEGGLPDGVRSFIIAVAGQLIRSPDMMAEALLKDHPMLPRLLDPHRVA